MSTLTKDDFKGTEAKVNNVESFVTISEDRHLKCDGTAVNQMVSRASDSKNQTATS
jgi:hypothetical protein